MVSQSAPFSGAAPTCWREPPEHSLPMNHREPTGPLLRMHSFGHTHLRPAVHVCASTDEEFPRSLRMHDLRQHAPVC